MPTPFSNLLPMSMPQPNNSVPGSDSGIIDPRHLRPEPADPSAGIDTHLELDSLSGPTEASNEPEDLEESPGLDDPRWLEPGPGVPSPSEPRPR
jgi:hypothetical protein